MKIISAVYTILIILTINSCNTTKNLSFRKEFIVNRIQNEMDGQILYLKDNEENDYTTIISPANGNFIELEVGNHISLIIKEIIKNNPSQIISSDIKIITKNMLSQIEYGKIEEEVFWISSRKIQANGIWGQPMECYQIQKTKSLNINSNWDILCDEIEYFNFIEGKFYQVKVLKKWLKNHINKNLMDRPPYDLELITVLSKKEDETYINPIKTKISTIKKTYHQGETIEFFMEVKNTGEKSYTFLPWGTPIENRFTSDCLEVKYNDKIVNYSGIMVKRTPPTEKDYITLEQGKKAIGKVNLLEGYQLNNKGIYTIQFKETYKGFSKSNIITIEIK